jgi:hypothetical protein
MAFSIGNYGKMTQYEIPYSDPNDCDPLRCGHVATSGMLIFPVYEGGWACGKCIQGCSVCLTVVLSTMQCTSCCDKACNDCRAVCHLCGVLHCTNCFRPVDGKRLCKACREQCRECLRWFEKDQVAHSETLDDIACRECIADFE